MEALRIDSLEEALLMATGLLLLVQLAYYLGLYARIARRERAVSKGKVAFSADLPPLSVIVCTSDQPADLEANLETILQQDYPQFEVIVINDGRTDDSEDLLTLLEERYRHLYHSFVPRTSRYVSHKKLAITLGIKASRYDWIVVTEPSCRPASDQWLRLLARNLTPGTEVVLGYSGYRPGRGWAHLRMAYDNLLTSMRYLGFALAGAPYMGIGRSLVYRKELFRARGGFTAHLELLRGDDDLLVNRIATGTNTRVETAPAAAMRLPADRRAKDWRDERVGYTLTARLYRGPQRYLAGLETTTRLLFYAAWVATLAVGLWHMHLVVAAVGLVAFGVRWAVQGSVTNRAARAVGDAQRYGFSLPLLDLVQPLLSLRWKAHCLLRRRSGFLRK